MNKNEIYVVVETDNGKNPRVFGEYAYTSKSSAMNKTRSLGQLVKNLNLEYVYSTKSLAWAESHCPHAELLII